MDLEDLPVSPEESINTGTENQPAVTSFENIIYYLSSIPHKYPEGLNVNQKRTLRKAAANFEYVDDKLYHVGKSQKRRLVVLSEETRHQVFSDSHVSPEGEHLGQKKTLDRIESFYFWRGIVRDVASWVHSCNECQTREERRMLGPSAKKVKVAEDSNVSLVTVNISAISEANPELQSAIGKAHATIRTLQQNLHAVHENERLILESAQRAQEDIDEVWDDIISRLIRMVSRQKRIMKEQVQTHKDRTLVPLRQARKQFEHRLRMAKKLLVDAEAAIKENSTESFLSKSSSILNAPEVVPCEDASPVYTVFTNEHTQQLLLKLVGETGYVCPQSPYGISGTKPFPGALRLSFDVERLDEIDRTKEDREKRFCPKELRIYYSAGTSCVPPASQASDNSFTLQSLASTCYLNQLQPNTMYSIFVSHRDEGSPGWSPWSAPYIASTSFPPYGWDAANGTWILSDDSSIATKILNTSTPPLYTSSAQFFPGCSLTFTVLDSPSFSPQDGIALVQQWVEGGALCQEGALFLNASGQLFIDGKFCSQVLDPLKPGAPVTWECDTEVETVGQGSQLQITITSQASSRVIHWSLQNHVTSLYFGAIFATQGTRIQIT